MKTVEMAGAKKMPANTLEILLELRGPMSRKERKDLETTAIEGAVLHLFHEGKISGRTAAALLGKTHYAFLEYAGSKGIPMVTSFEPAKLERLVRQLRRPGKRPK